MSVSRWAVSLLIVWHLVAIVIAAIPRPTRPADEPSLPGRAARAAAALAAPLHASRALQTPVNAYIGVLGLGQRWTMFSSPPKDDEYVRVRYYIGSSSSLQRPAWTATELVMPAHREDRVRVLQSFRDSYRDKAIANALGNFYRRRPAHLVRPDTLPGALPDDLAPIARYFARSFADRYLEPGETVVRTEVWVGSAAMSPPGSPAAVDDAEWRQSVLRGYYEGPVENRYRVPPYPPYHGAEQEADIRWVLEYFEGA
jgi:hypothetical protein